MIMSIDFLGLNHLNPVSDVLEVKFKQRTIRDVSIVASVILITVVYLHQQFLFHHLN